MLGKRTPAASCKFPLGWVRCIPLRKKQVQAHAHGSPPRANHFNLLRFMLASMVIVSHVPDLIDGDRRREPLAMLFHTISLGELAVDGFFVLSGYLILTSWQRLPSAGAYLRARLLRIVPGFVVCSLLCVLVVAPLHDGGGAAWLHSVQWPAYLKSLLTLKQPDVPPVFVGSHMPTLNGPMWSISYEFKCYLVVLVAGLMGWARKRPVWLALAIAFAALHLAINLHLVNDMRGRVPDVRCLMLFLIGGCFKLYAPALPWRGSLAVAALGMMLVCLSSNVLAHLGTAVFGGYLLCFVALHLGGWLLAFNQLPDVSYGMYLYGWPVNKLVLWWGPQQLAPALALTFALTLVMAWLSWVLIESPALRLKR